MPVEPSKKVIETRIIQREEGAAQQRKKPKPRKEEQKKGQDMPGKVDIKV